MQLLEKLELVTKIMFGYHGNKKSADFYTYLSENQQFYQVHEKIIHFSFFLFSLNTQNCSEVPSFQKIFCFQV